MKYYFVSGGAEEVEAILAVAMEAGVEVTEAGGGAGTETRGRARLITEAEGITTETEATTREGTTTDTAEEVTRRPVTTATCARS